MNIIVLRASKMLRRLKQRGLHFLFKLCACFFANTFVVFLPLVHSLAASRHLWPRRHQTTDAGQGFLFVAARSTTATTGRLNFEPQKVRQIIRVLILHFNKYLSKKLIISRTVFVTISQFTKATYIYLFIKRPYEKTLAVV